jgi:hypothetical protein
MLPFDADLCHIRVRSNQGAVADGCVQTLAIVKYFVVIGYRRFGFFASTEAGLVAMSFFSEAKKLTIGALSRQSPRAAPRAR